MLTLKLLKPHFLKLTFAEAKFVQANFANVIFAKAKCANATLARAACAKAKFAKAKFAEAEFAGAELANAKLVKAKSSNAKLMILNYGYFQSRSCWDNLYVREVGRLRTRWHQQTLKAIGIWYFMICFFPRLMLVCCLVHTPNRLILGRRSGCNQRSLIKSEIDQLF